MKPTSACVRSELIVIGPVFQVSSPVSLAIGPVARSVAGFIGGGQLPLSSDRDLVLERQTERKTGREARFLRVRHRVAGEHCSAE